MHSRSKADSFLTGKSAADKLQDLQEWVIEPGEEVRLEGISTSTPTDFVIKAGGTLVVNNCDFYMVGKHHHDNYIKVYGNLEIIDSAITGEEGIHPSIETLNPEATVEIRNSVLGGGEGGWGFP